MKLCTLLPLFLLSPLVAADTSIKQDEEPVEFEVEVDIECEGDSTKKVNLHNGIYAGKVSLVA